MRGRFQRINSICHALGGLLQVQALILLFPLIPVCWFWNQFGDGWRTVVAFVIPATLSFVLGFIFRTLFKSERLDKTGALIMCALSWLAAAAIGAIPFVIGIEATYLDGYFEAMSGFTTTGITVFDGLDTMPRSILFWRSLTQWLGGLGILSFFLVATFWGAGAHHILVAESHKVFSSRPTPGLTHTLTIFWTVYGLFTVAATAAFYLAGMTVFDGVCHAFTALSTGGFSPYDASIAHYRLSGHANYRLIEYTVTFFMMLGGINFLVHYRVLIRDIKALWDHSEIRMWWGLLLGFTLIVMGEHLRKHGFFAALCNTDGPINLATVEQAFRTALFQVISLMTTTGFGTEDIGSNYFGAASQQLFLVMMVIGGCVGSTGGGFKVLRIVVLQRLIKGEIFRSCVSSQAVSGLVMDGRIIPAEEIDRVAGLFYAWMGFIALGGVVTAAFSQLGPLASASGMFSALGNIGPCYISVPDMIVIHPVIKVTYIVGMLAGRLEILPVLLLLSPRAWR
ncbi:TrkH family potassium uptake protein [Planctomycetota bacterium]